MCDPLYFSQPSRDICSDICISFCCFDNFGSTLYLLFKKDATVLLLLVTVCLGLY